MEVTAGNGFDVLLPERNCPTLLATYVTADHGLSGVFTVMASHNPSEYNGVKLILSDGVLALLDVIDAVAE